MTHTTVLRSLIVVAAATVSLSAQGKAPDGNAWLQWGDTPRTFYVTGLIDSSDLFAHLLISADADDTQAAETYVRAMKAVADGSPRATVGQLRDGLTALYQDFRNRSIAITAGLYIVFKQIGGMPQRDVDALIERMRAGAK